MLRPMSRFPPHCHALTGRSRRALAGLVLWVGAVSAFAMPDSGSDAVTRLLEERGLLPQAATPAAEPVAPPAPAPGLAQRMQDKASDMVISAMNFLGVPYRRGGSSETAGFDCSGFTRHIFEMSVGLVLPRRVDEQAGAPGLVAIRRDELKPGDLVFFNTLRRTFSHVGIYVGDGKFIHSPRTGGEVRVEDMRYAYWSKRFTGARRAEALEAASPGDPGATVSPVEPTLLPAALR
jgi:cell wall-associated NlpC family hydrolase